MYELVPKELTALNRWVCAYRGGKAPMKPFERGGASTVDPATWGDFETACAAVEEGYYDDIGFVFAGDGLVGIDIDAGFGEDRLPTPEAMDVLSKCESYTELSRSGRGYHVFLRGDLPFDGMNNRRGMEIYKTKRYFIVTGRRVAFDRIIENGEAIRYVLDTYFNEADAQAQRPEDRAAKPKIYRAAYRKPTPSGVVDMTPEYPAISEGSRHISMVSLAGTLRTAGYSGEYIYEELCRANELACRPPLKKDEIRQIVKSIRKYER